jgi:DNA-binding transcriptional regulator LsrR (DeoR family)
VSSTRAEIADATTLPERTVQGALTDLREEGLVGARPSLQDARALVYFLDDE